MIKKIFIILICVLCMSQQLCLAGETTASQPLAATLSRTTPSGGGTGTKTGGIIAGGVVGGTAAGGATALAFAPLLLAGLAPNEVISAAAPLYLICKRKWYLEIAIREHCVNLKEIEQFPTDKYFVAQNDTDILNGTYDVDEIKLPDTIKNFDKIKIKVTIASQPYGENKGTPDLSLGIYKDISRTDLNKKFETQQFLHHYLMKKYEIPLKITSGKYGKGIQKLTGYINKNEITDINLKKINPKSLTYAYLIEFSK